MTAPQADEHYLHGRLERLELKIDRLVEAVTQIARLEERIGQSLDKTSRIEDELQDLRHRLDNTEKGQVKSGVYTGIVERLIFQALGLMAAGVLGAIFAFFRFGGGT